MIDSLGLVRSGSLRHVVLFSGGLDSLITCRYVGHHIPGGSEAIVVYFHLRHRYEEMEIQALSRVSSGNIIDDRRLRGLGDTERDDAIIPARNAHMVLAAGDYLPSIEGVKNPVGCIWLTAQKDERTTHDKTPQFFEAMSGMMTAMLGYPIRVVTPWDKYDKTEMVAWYLKDGGSKIELLKTWSCYSGDKKNGGLPCGNCPACIRRHIAFTLNGLSEKYVTPPRNSETGRDYVMRAEEGRYSEERCRKILEVLK